MIFAEIGTVVYGENVFAKNVKKGFFLGVNYAIIVIKYFGRCFIIGR